jgi:phytoene dehydrogenase-like protein
MGKTEYDAVVVGSGPNGMAAAITLQRAGLSVLVLEGKSTIGGGTRSAELTLPGYVHDVCSAIHPMASISPFLQSLALREYGLEFIEPPVLAAHPFDGGRAAVLLHSLEKTAGLLGEDRRAYLDLFDPILKNWPRIEADILGPLRIPKHPLAAAGFGLKALASASSLAGRFRTTEARGLFAGMAAHSSQPLSKPTTAAIGLILSIAGHIKGWPIPRGGSQSIANALAGYFVSLGGKIETDFYVRSFDQLPSSRAILLDVTPRQLLSIAGDEFSSLYRWQLKRYRYGPGVFKIDWALDGPVPFTATQCREAGTIHLGNTFEEIAHAEFETAQGRHSERPFVLLAQPSLFDPSRAPKGKQTVWGYCHVPNGSHMDMSEAIEAQVERFAPGFRDRILARHAMNSIEMEAYNPNYVGGDIGGGVIDLGQLFARPALRLSPYRTSVKGIYLCSASTPPGGGVHGLCGYHAAQRALRDLFRSQVKAGIAVWPENHSERTFS